MLYFVKQGRLRVIEYLSLGILLGLYAGLTPGPLLTLVVSETLQHDFKAGFKVAIAPVVSDAPIILLSLFAIHQLADFQPILGMISLVGACYLIWMGVESLRFQGLKLQLETPKSHALRKGILVNVLSPYPYLFWFSVGAPLLVKAMEKHALAPALFIMGFYTLLVGLKVLLAYLIGKSKALLEGRAYILGVRSLGFALLMLAFSLFMDAKNLLGFL